MRADVRINNIDIDLIKEQRDELMLIVDNDLKNGMDSSNLQGIVNLLDHIIDSDIEERILKTY